MESLEAYEALDETLELVDFEVLLVGPQDLSASLGVPGQKSHPKVEKIMRKNPKFIDFKDAYDYTRKHILSGKSFKHLKKIQNV